MLTGGLFLLIVDDIARCLFAPGNSSRRTDGNHRSAVLSVSHVSWKEEFYMMSNYTEKHTKKYMKKGIAAVIFLFALCLICGCGQKEEKKAVYEITAEGSAQESGVIAFAGLEMNVYQDPRPIRAEIVRISRSAFMWEPICRKP